MGEKAPKETKPNQALPIRKASRYVLLLELFNRNAKDNSGEEIDSELLLGVGGMAVEDVAENWDQLRFQP